MRKVEDKTRVSKKELRLTKKSIGTLIKYIALFGSMRKKHISMYPEISRWHTIHPKTKTCVIASSTFTGSVKKSLGVQNTNSDINSKSGCQDKSSKGRTCDYRFYTKI